MKNKSGLLIILLIIFAFASLFWLLMQRGESINNSEPDIGGVRSVIIDQDSLIIEVGDVLVLAANVVTFGAADEDITWSSDDSLVATVNDDGVVTGVAEGSATISATSVVDADKRDGVVLTVQTAKGDGGGVLLIGPPDAPASTAMKAFEASDIGLVDESVVTEIETDGEKILLIRNELAIFFVEDVTVGQVNLLLAELGGRIVSMTPVTPNVVVRISDPGSVEALEALATMVEERPEVRFVDLGWVFPPEPTLFMPPSLP